MRDKLSLLRNNAVSKLADYVRNMCNLMISDKETKGIILPNNENKIRTTLLEEYLNQDEGLVDWRFLPEMYTNYNGNGSYLGRADLYALLKTDFDKKDAFFIAECKRLDGLATLNKKYVTEGISRFVANNPKYSSYYGTSMMIGFVIKTVDMHTNAKKIESLQNEAADQAMHGKWVFKDDIGKTVRFECIYRNRQKSITLQHLFADFSRIVESHQKVSTF